MEAFNERSNSCEHKRVKRRECRRAGARRNAAAEDRLFEVDEKWGYLNGQMGGLGGGAAFGKRAADGKPKQVVKEGLSEYFIYTIEGTETIPNGWSKRLRSFESPRVPLKTVYRYRVPEYGDQLVRLYLLANDKASTLGETPLPDSDEVVLKRQPVAR